MNSGVILSTKRESYNEIKVKELYYQFTLVSLGITGDY